MKHLSTLAVVLIAVTSTYCHAAERAMVSTSNSTSSRFNWSKLIGIGVDIKFGTNVPKCKCCYGGLCEIKVTSAIVQNGPLNDNQIATFANTLLPNDQAGIAVAETGEAYVILNRAISRPDFVGSTLILQAPVAWDPELQTVYNIAPMLAGSYPIEDNGLFKMIRIN